MFQLNRTKGRRRRPGPARALALALLALLPLGAGASGQEGQGRPLFRSGVDLVNVTATVTDEDGHFVKGLVKEDFVLLEDGVEKPISQFSSERVPVSLGIVVDASSSMDGKRMSQARAALEELLDRLPDPDDEIFLYSFSEEPVLEQGWTTSRKLIRSALRKIDPSGRTSLYDAVSEAVKLANTGRHAKKALVVISDGNDTASRTSVEALRLQIQESELLVYAIGVESSSRFDFSRRSTFFDEGFTGFRQAFPGRPRPQLPGFPPRPRPGGGGIPFPRPPRTPAPPVYDDPVDVEALRSFTDNSGGRTEVVRTTADLGPATSGIADEFDRQYFLAYASGAPRDGKWHTIRLRVRDRDFTVRARRGFIAR